MTKEKSQKTISAATDKIDFHQIVRALSSLRNLREGKASEKKKSLLPENDEKVWLQFAFKKIPILNQKTKYLKLPHAIPKDKSSVCVFVKDLDKKDRDFEPTIHHFKELLESKGVHSSIDVMPLKQVKLEYKPFEAKRNLSNMYDTFLADERIFKFISPLLGRAFFKKKKQPCKINLKAPDLKKEFENVLSRGRCVIDCKGSSSSAHVANFDMEDDEIAKNIEAASDQLFHSIPGGPQNIKNFYIKTDKSVAIPIYVSLESSNEVELPPVESDMEDESEELSTFMHAKVKVSKHGDVFVENDVDASDGEYDFDDDVSSDDETMVRRFIEKKTKGTGKQDQSKVNKKNKLGGKRKSTESEQVLTKKKKSEKDLKSDEKNKVNDKKSPDSKKKLKGKVGKVPKDADNAKKAKIVKTISVTEGGKDPKNTQDNKKKRKTVQKTNEPKIGLESSGIKHKSRPKKVSESENLDDTIEEPVKKAVKKDISGKISKRSKYEKSNKPAKLVKKKPKSSR